MDNALVSIHYKGVDLGISQFLTLAHRLHNPFYVFSGSSVTKIAVTSFITAHYSFYVPIILSRLGASHSCYNGVHQKLHLCHREKAQHRAGLGPFISHLNSVATRLNIHSLFVESPVSVKVCDWE